jgi:hypothetical protein
MQPGYATVYRAMEYPAALLIGAFNQHGKNSPINSGFIHPAQFRQSVCF